jgi:hypothetical protein
MKKEAMNENRVFSDEELFALPRYRPDLMRELIQGGRYGEARTAFEDLHRSVVKLHDGAFTWCAGLLTWILERDGADALQAAQKQTLALERADVLPRCPQPDFDAAVRHEARLLRGINCQEMKLTEDAEKVTIELTPCGNGGRLIDMAYEPDAGIARLRGQSPLTFGEEELPVYCASCASKELREVEECGKLRTVHAAESVAPPKGSGCKLHIYKDPDDVPEEYYTRLGKLKPARSDFSPVKPARVFTDAQLCRLGESPEEVLIGALSALEKGQGGAPGCAHSGEAESLLALFDKYYEEKTAMHDAVGCWVGGLLTWVYERHGLEAVGEAERFAHAIEGEIALEHTRASSVREAVLGCLSALHGHVHQHMSMTEDDGAVTIQVNPCGSGGRMIERAFDPDLGFARLQGPAPLTWGMDELPVYCVHCPVLEQMTVDGSGGFAFVHSLRTTSGQKPPVCEYVFYKNPADIPEVYFSRIGRRKPVEE